MRELADSARIERFMRAFGRAVGLHPGSGWLGGPQPADSQGGQARVHHFDPLAPALSKAERGHDQDIRDVREMISSGLVDPAEARAQFEQIEPLLYRFPAIDPASFRAVVEELFPV